MPATSPRPAAEPPAAEPPAGPLARAGGADSAAAPLPERFPDERAVPERYRELYDRVIAQIDADDPKVAGWTTSYKAGHRPRLCLDLCLCDLVLPPGGRVLEIGSAPFFLTAALSELGYDVTGLDLAPERYRTAVERFGLTVLRRDVERDDLSDLAGRFDLVLCNEVFEHLRIDLIGTFRQVLGVLKPGGRLMLSTPNLRSWRGLTALIRDHRAVAVSGTDVFGEWSILHDHGHMGHVREYTPREVAGFLDRVGFESERFVYRGGLEGRRGRALYRVVPSLKPFFTVIARRPAGDRRPPGRPA